MMDAPLSPGLPPESPPPDLKFLKTLVTVLTGTMIAGLVVVIALLVIRLPTLGRGPALPDTITLPDGARAMAFTRGAGWYAVVTHDNSILIYDQATGALRQTIRIVNP